MTQDAVVTRLLPNNMAEVAVARTTACGGNCPSCESCIFQSELKTLARNRIQARPGQKVVIVDDLIATGGTVEAAAELIEDLGGIVSKMVFLMELRGLNGRERLSKYDVASVISYEGK